MYIFTRFILNLIGLLCLCLGSASIANAEVNQSESSVSQAPSFFGYADVGSGRKMYIECRGTGTPTVILVSGLANRTDTWKESDAPQFPSVFSKVSTFTRVCVYDRPGTILSQVGGFDKSRSDPIPQPTSAKQAADDLHALLIAANQPGPYVLVGHSYGGLIARTYAALYDNIAGLVLVDALSEGLYKLSADDWNYFDKKLNGVSEEMKGYNEFERIDYVNSFKQVKKMKHDVPTIVITAGIPPDFTGLPSEKLVGMPPGFPDRLWKAQLKAQDDLAHLFPGANHIMQNNSGHYIHIEQPQIVTDSIYKVVRKVQKR